ncbi:type II toxin-antitoxin system RelE/ParE family toxin [Morganella morganii]|uniref:type II toxin-antitoxin system RelE/ParE family toxin n=1 Tax=Morganella morganii TaxID=582 RepID=UPI0030FF3342
MDYLEFIETKIFSHTRKEMMTDDEFREFQSYLLENYERGNTISQTGGCKKIRWQRRGTGKQGGLRVIYHALPAHGKLYLLLIYPKNVKDDLSSQERTVLRSLSQKLN